MAKFSLMQSKSPPNGFALVEARTWISGICHFLGGEEGTKFCWRDSSIWAVSFRPLARKYLSCSTIPNVLFRYQTVWIDLIGSSVMGINERPNHPSPASHIMPPAIKEASGDEKLQCFKVTDSSSCEHVENKVNMGLIHHQSSLDFLSIDLNGTTTENTLEPPNLS